MDKIDVLIESVGDYLCDLSGYSDSLKIYKGVDGYFTDWHDNPNEFICTVGEYKERLHKQELIKLIESACTDDAASIANVILRNGWAKR